MAADRGKEHLGRFRLGINYWPARTAMGWWAEFDRAEVAADFARIAAHGFDSVRLFLTWEDFQPAPDRVDASMLRRLALVLDLADAEGLAVIPTLFTGHMSGVNWIPAWALGGSDGDQRFRVVSGGRVTASGLRNWYSDPSITEAQVRLAGEAAAALAGHPTLWAWDLGNENSNCLMPPTRSSGRDWLRRITEAIRAADATALVTVGLHMEDLEEDRRLGPGEAAEVCDLLQMHGYPIYARWADDATDEQMLPFLAHLSRWLGDGRDLLFSEFGLPTSRRDDPPGQRAGSESAFQLVDEDVAAAYTGRALAALRDAGCVGAMLWCYADYAPAIWHHPPLDVAVHERSFGLWRADGSAKPAVAVVEAFAGASLVAGPADYPWIDIERHELLADPSTQLQRLYRRFRDGGDASPR